MTPTPRACRAAAALAGRRRRRCRRRRLTPSAPLLAVPSSSPSSIGSSSLHVRYDVVQGIKLTESYTITQWAPNIKNKAFLLRNHRYNVWRRHTSGPACSIRVGRCIRQGKGCWWGRRGGSPCPRVVSGSARQARY
jgi:hypothetical protein